jgi:hypothetical protein
MTSQAPQSAKAPAFSMDWAFGGVQLEKLLLEKLVEQIRESRNADNGFRKPTFVALALSITVAYHSAGAPTRNVVTWQQVKAKINAVSHPPQSQ